jgi:hypothetical protein
MAKFNILKNYIPFIIPNYYTQEKTIMELERNNEYLNSILKSDNFKRSVIEHNENTPYFWCKINYDEIFSKIINNNNTENFNIKNILKIYNKKVCHSKQINCIETYYLDNEVMQCYIDKIYLKIKDYDDIFKYQSILNSNKSKIKETKLFNRNIYNDISSKILSTSSFFNKNTDKEIIDNIHIELTKNGVLVEENKNCNKCHLLKKYLNEYASNINNEDSYFIVYIEKELDNSKYCTLYIDK